MKTDKSDLQAIHSDVSCTPSVIISVAPCSVIQIRDTCLDEDWQESSAGDPQWCILQTKCNDFITNESVTEQTKQLIFHPLLLTVDTLCWVMSTDLHRTHRHTLHSGTVLTHSAGSRPPTYTGHTGTHCTPAQCWHCRDFMPHRPGRINQDVHVHPVYCEF